MTGPLVVTDTGVVSAAGDTAADVLAAVVRGVPLESASIEAFDAKRYLSRRGLKDLSRLSQLACSAAAANAARLAGVPAENVGVVFGTAWGSLKTVIDFEREAHLQGVRFVDPLLFTETVSNVPAGQVAILHGWSAFNATVSSGAASGLAGIRQAIAFLDQGRGSVAIAGGGDETNPRLEQVLRKGGWSGAASGEGACFLTIERAAHAESRGAKAAAFVRSTAERFAVPPAELIRDLAAGAGCALSEIDLVVLSASAETAAVLEVFGDGAGAPEVVHPKVVLGETWGASGALAATVAIERIRSRQIRNAMILDTTEGGHALGLVLAAGPPS